MIAWFAASHLVSMLTGGGLLKMFFGNLLGDLRAVAAWLRRHSIWLTVSIALAAGWGVDHIISHRHAAKVETQLTKCTSARHADRAAYTAAQAAAQEKNLADIARDKAERERITNAVSQNYEAELASVRADLARRLRQPNPVKGAPGQPGLPGVSQAPSGVDGGSRVSIPSGLYVRGAELEVQLEQLQRWVDQQSQVKH